MEMEPLETFTCEGHTVNIYPERDSQWDVVPGSFGYEIEKNGREVLRMYGFDDLLICRIDAEREAEYLALKEKQIDHPA